MTVVWRPVSRVCREASLDAASPVTRYSLAIVNEFNHCCSGKYFDPFPD